MSEISEDHKGSVSIEGRKSHEPDYTDGLAGKVQKLKRLINKMTQSNMH